MRRLAFIGLVMVLPGLGWGQSAPSKETLADIRQELEVVNVMILQLKRELSTTQSPGLLNARGSFQERIDAVEFALQRLTSQSEELENRIESVVADGSMRIGDLMFRVCEIEPGCDMANLEMEVKLGGDDSTEESVGNDPGHDIGGQFALGEQDDFDKALQAFEAEDFDKAVSLFEQFNATYPAGPLAAAAHLYRGLSLDGIGETGEAARAYLNAFSVNPDGAEAPAALFQLGLSLNALGQTNQACVTLAEVGVRFPTDIMVEKAENARMRIGCS